LLALESQKNASGGSKLAWPDKPAIGTVSEPVLATRLAASRSTKALTVPLPLGKAIAGAATGGRPSGFAANNPL
jgi:hypothetical protein